MSKRFFSAESTHGSSTSFGFDNDITVRAFDSRRARNAYVERSYNLSCKPIVRAAVTQYASNYSLTENRSDKPDTFAGEYWGIVPDTDDIPGCIGTVEVCGSNDNFDKLYKI